MKSRVKKFIWVAPVAIMGIALFVFLGGVIVMLLWNAILPPLFGWPPVGFWQALGILVLCRLLFGRWGGHSRRRRGDRHDFRWRTKKRWSGMTSEERERFRQRLRERFGFDSAADRGQE